MNAFDLARPKAAEAPAKQPRRTNHSRAPMEGTLRTLAPVNIHDEAKAKQEYQDRIAAKALLNENFLRRKRTKSKTAAERVRETQKDVPA